MLLHTLRAWRLEVGWFAALVAVVAVLAGTTARVSADDYCYYDEVFNWCFDLQPEDCLVDN